MKAVVLLLPDRAADEAAHRRYSTVTVAAPLPEKLPERVLHAAAIWLPDDWATNESARVFHGAGLLGRLVSEIGAAAVPPGKGRRK